MPLATSPPAQAGTTGTTPLASATQGDQASGTAQGVEAAKGTDATASNGGAASTAAKESETKVASTPAGLELKFPDGVAVDQELVSKFKPIAQELGLDSAKAQKLVDLVVSRDTAHAAAVDAALAKQRAGWIEASKSDKAIGGADYEKNLQIAHKAIVQFGDKELASLLEDTGLVHHPAIVRLLHKTGKALGEDSLSGASGGAAAGANSDRAFQRSLYDKSPGLFKE